MSITYKLIDISSYLFLLWSENSLILSNPVPVEEKMINEFQSAENRKGGANL